MTPENQLKLVERFPNLYRECWEIGGGDGWFQLIWNLGLQIEQVCRAHNVSIDQYPIVKQQKEKFGQLRYYWELPEDFSKDILDIVYDLIYDLAAKAERESLRICDWCGESGTPISSNGWLTTRCTKHLENSWRDKEEM